MSELKPIILNTSHTHAGVTCKTGETIWVAPIISNWLIARGVGITPPVTEPSNKPTKTSKKAKE